MAHAASPAKQDYSQPESTTHNKMQQLAGQPASRGAISTLFAATEPSLAGGLPRMAAPGRQAGCPLWRHHSHRCPSTMPTTQPLGRHGLRNLLVASDRAHPSNLTPAPQPPPAGGGRSGSYFGPYYFRLPNWFSAHFPFTLNVGQTLELQPANSLARDPGAR